MRRSGMVLWLAAASGVALAREAGEPRSAQAASGNSTPTISAEPAPTFPGIPGVTITYYDVTGRTPAAIRASMNAQRPTDSNDGKRVDALSRWSMRWRWRGDGRGGCDLATTQIDYSATVLLPRLADPAALSAANLARWQLYLAALTRHEDGHLRHAHEQVGTVLAAMRAATCATATEVGRATLARIAEHDVAYDRETKHGATQGATFP